MVFEIQKSINDMSLDEIHTYISNRIKEIKSEITSSKKQLSILEKSIKSNQKNIKIVASLKDIDYIRKIGEQYGLKLNPDPMFINLHKVIITDKIESTNKAIQKEIIELKKHVVFLKGDLNTIDTCPLCGGMGQKVEVEYIRQGGMVTPIKHVKECHACKGTGKIMNI